MRIGIFSDVHANIEAMNAVIDAYKSERIDKYVCIGDVVGYGASPNECCDLIRRTAAYTILGNHDAWRDVSRIRRRRTVSRAAAAVSASSSRSRPSANTV